MCEYIVQHAAPQKLASCFLEGEISRIEVLGVSAKSTDASDHGTSAKGELIKPGMQLTGIRHRGTTLECLPVRWGWSPFWSSGTLAPLTHLPLHLVMRSKVFNRVKRDGRMLVAVEGWYEPLDTGMTVHSRNLAYTTSRQPAPMFLAALAQGGGASNGCEGLALVTHEDVEMKRQRLLAFAAQNALAWLSPDLEWEQARVLAVHRAVIEPQLEHVLTSQRTLRFR
ncbi:SOS response-associated peptidase family protein [Pseudomonas retamae]|uniref:SOS response-associated peptidase family protein n=1 Tax=Pseudomonas retamae TaxID=702110 RepID=A0ABW7DGV0_9PSED